MNKKTFLGVFAWGLGALVLALGLVVWAHERLGHGDFTTYKLFPILGLSAFSLMWTHYIIGAVRRALNEDKSAVKSYGAVTGAVVLALIILHPGLLWYQLWRDGLGLPPKSYLNAYPAFQHLALLAGSTSLLIFLSFEFKKFLQKKAVWKYIEYLQIVAMFAIFYHGLTLGDELEVGWYRAVWFFYGISLAGALVYNHWYDAKKVTKESK
jgi:hypothetical protein